MYVLGGDVSVDRETFSGDFLKSQDAMTAQSLCGAYRNESMLMYRSDSVVLS